MPGVTRGAEGKCATVPYAVEKIKEKEKDARTGTQKYTKILCTAGALVSRLPDKISSIPTIGLCDLHMVYSNSVH